LQTLFCCKLKQLCRLTSCLFSTTGKLIMCRVSGFAHKRPKGDQLDQADPVRNDETGLWQCPFCLKSDLPELSEVRSR